MKIPLLPIHIITSKTLKNRDEFSNKLLAECLKQNAQMSGMIVALPPKIRKKYCNGTSKRNKSTGRKMLADS